jgi:hypothetical protein
MNIELIQRVLREKRVQHPELVSPLSWQSLQRITRREGIGLVVAPWNRPAGLVQFDGRWTIVIDSGSTRGTTRATRRTSSRISGCTSTLTLGRNEICMNFTYPESTDPREDEADFFAHALIYGPRYFSNEKVAALVHACELEPDLSAVYLEGDGRFRMPVVGESFCEGHSSSSAVPADQKATTS